MLHKPLRAWWDEHQARRARALRDALYIHPALLAADGRTLRAEIAQVRAAVHALRDRIERLDRLRDRVERLEQARRDDLASR